MRKIINDIKSTIYCKYIHMTKKVNSDKFKCTCSSCKYFKECDKSYYTYVLNEIHRLNDEFLTCSFECMNCHLDEFKISCNDFCSVNMQLMNISYQANYWNRILKFYDESEE